MISSGVVSAQQRDKRKRRGRAQIEPKLRKKKNLHNKGKGLIKTAGSSLK